MVRRFLFLVLATALIPAGLRAQEPEKKPDAFEYFFGKKREEKREEKKEAPAKEEAPAPAEKPAEREPAPEPETAPEPKPAPVARPEMPAKPAPVVEEPKPEEPKGDAFRYFFGCTTQPAEAQTEEKASGKKPVDAFEYFFGKDGKAGVDEEKPKSPPPSR